MNTPSKQPKKRKPAGKKGGKKTYKVRNWKEYNEALVNRGRVFFWITDEAIQAWEEEQKAKKKRGRPKLFSNTAIETALTLGQVFHLSLRQTEGFVSSILRQIGADVKAPDYSTLCIRARTLSAAIRVRPCNTEPLHIAVDSTGVKVYGEGEWKVRQHGWSKRRSWKKLHIGIDENTGDILMGAVTENDIADCEAFAYLLEQLPDHTVLSRVSADGGYDKRVCYDELSSRDVPTVAIPPQKNAKIWQHGNVKAKPLARDENLRRIRTIGRKRWKEETRYHCRSLVETAMFRLKTIFGGSVSRRIAVYQRTELLLRCKALNRMTMLGMPDSYCVA